MKEAAIMKTLIALAGAAVAVALATSGSPYLAFWTFFFTLQAVV